MFKCALFLSMNIKTNIIIPILSDRRRQINKQTCLWSDWRCHAVSGALAQQRAATDYWEPQPPLLWCPEEGLNLGWTAVNSSMRYVMRYRSVNGGRLTSHEPFEASWRHQTSTESNHWETSDTPNIPIMIWWHGMTWTNRAVKGIIRPFELEEIYIFYYLIDVGEFSYSNDMH